MQGDEVLIKNPYMLYMTLEANGKMHAYQTIKVMDIRDVLINKKPLLSNYSKE